MSKIITNEVFECAWSDVNNRKIISEVLSKYKGIISKDELLYRSYMALFNCLKQHNPASKTKFTSSLYRHIHWQCSKALREKAKDKALFSLDSQFYLESKVCSETHYVKDCLEALPKKHSEILKKYYFDRMTLKEIGLVNGYTTPSTMHHLRQAEEAFKRLYDEH